MKKKRAFVVLASIVVCFLVCAFVFKDTLRIGLGMTDDRPSIILNGKVDLQDSELKEGYCFYWNHLMGPKILITVTVDNDQIQLSYKKAVCLHAGICNLQFVNAKELLLTSEQIEHLRKTVDDNQFWNEEIITHMGMDGANWTVEVKQNGSYYSEQQWMPESGGLHNIAVCLLELSPYDTEADKFRIVKND